MAVDPVSNQTDFINAVTPVKNARKVNDFRQGAEETAAVFEKSQQPTQAGKLYNKDTVSKMKAELGAKYSGLRTLVEKLLSGQNARFGAVKGISFEHLQKSYDGDLHQFFGSLTADEDTRLKAEADIAEDGYWGVQQASQRLVDFAKSLAGRDPSKAAELKAAMEKGFANAERAWGGELPAICRQTIDAALDGIGEWANGPEQA